MTAPITSIDPKQVGREAAAKYFEATGGQQTAANCARNGTIDNHPVVSGRIAGATEMLARMGGADGVWVPRNPTEEQSERIYRETLFHGRGVTKEAYQKILNIFAAAPSQPAHPLDKITAWAEENILNNPDLRPTSVLSKPAGEK